jgi:hypothetical protein
MNILRLEVRLRRLERALKEGKLPERKKLPSAFLIESKLAKALWTDCERLAKFDTLQRAMKGLSTNNYDDDTPEEIKLRNRIRRNAKKIKCPASYGLKEFLDDQETLWASKRDKDDLLPGQEEFFIDDLEDADKAQLVARMEAYKQTSEGQARFRLEELLEKHGWKSVAEHEEIALLMQQYPEPLQHPSSFIYGLAPRPSLQQLKAEAERDRGTQKG